MRKGLRTMADYKSTSQRMSEEPSLPDTLKSFFSRFDATSDRENNPPIQPEEQYHP